MDERLVARGLTRAPFGRFLLWLAALGRPPRGRALRRVPLPRGGPQPDEHGQPLRLRALDLPGPDRHRARGGGLLHRLPPLRDEEARARRRSSTARWSSASSATRARSRSSRSTSGQPLRVWFTFWHPNVHSMLTEVTFCLTLLPHRAGHRVPAARPAQPAAQEAPLDARLRVRAAQGDGRLRPRGHVPVLLPPGLARRALRRPPGAPLRVPRVARRLALDLLPLHPLRRGGGAELRPRDHLDRVEGLGAEAGQARGLRPSRPRLRLAPPRLRPREERRHPRVDQPTRPSSSASTPRASTRSPPSGPGRSSPRSSSWASSPRSSSPCRGRDATRASSSPRPSSPARASP